MNLFCLLIDIGGVIFENLLDLEGFIEDVLYFCLCEVGFYYILLFELDYIENICFGVFGCNLIILIDYSSYDFEIFIKGGIGLFIGIEVIFFLSLR